jgi:hypothetical protein
MERLRGLDFIDTNFSIHYTGSDEPQMLEIRARVEKPVRFPLGPAVLPLLCNVVNQGGGGGAEFSPVLGRAALLEGPTGTDPGAEFGEYYWRLELTAVSPLFIRNLVDRLRPPDLGWRLLELHIVGSKPFEAGLPFVDTNRFRSWLVDRDAYLGAWRELPFSVEHYEILRGAGVKLALEMPFDHSVLVAFEQLLLTYHQAISGYVNGSDEYDGVADATPRIAQSRLELAGAWDAFDFASGPVQRELLNMLFWFHHRVAAARSVALAFQS